MKRNESKIARIIPFVILAIYTIFLTILAAVDNDPKFTMWSEEAFFEKFSEIAWLIASLAAITTARHYWPSALLFAMCAAREADWHKKFFTNGIFKIRHYTENIASLPEKILSALIAGLFIGLIVHLLVKSFHFLRQNKLQFDLFSVYCTIAISLFFVSKIIDRSASLLSNHFGITTQENVMRYKLAYEEGFELLTPLFLAVAFGIKQYFSKYAKNQQKVNINFRKIFLTIL